VRYALEYDNVGKRVFFLDREESVILQHGPRFIVASESGKAHFLGCYCRPEFPGGPLRVVTPQILRSLPIC